MVGSSVVVVVVGTAAVVCNRLVSNITHPHHSIVLIYVIAGEGA